MSLDIMKSCSFQILISLTTVVRPGYCHLKSEVAALDWCWCCQVVFCSDASPSTDLPITDSVVLRGIRVASSSLVTTAADKNVSESDKKCLTLGNQKILDMNPKYFVTKSEINN